MKFIRSKFIEILSAKFIQNLLIFSFWFLILEICFTSGERLGQLQRASTGNAIVIAMVNQQRFADHYRAVWQWQLYFGLSYHYSLDSVSSFWPLFWTSFRLSLLDLFASSLLARQTPFHWLPADQSLPIGRCCSALVDAVLLKSRTTNMVSCLGHCLLC